MELKNISQTKEPVSATHSAEITISPTLHFPNRSITIWDGSARAKFRYLQKCHKVLFANLMTGGTPGEYLHSVDVTCEEAFALLRFKQVRGFFRKCVFGVQNAPLS